MHPKCPDFGIIHCLGVFCILAATSTVSRAAPGNVDVTYLLFSQQWSVGYCSGAYQDKCITENERNFWTIHGLWPSSNKSDPEFCNKTLRYNATVLQPIVEQLELYWPSVTVKNFNIFWKHEWQKHGTCATMVPELDGLFNFFNSTLNLFYKYNLTEYLYNSGVTPSSQKAYTLEAVRMALLDDMKESTNFVCYNNKNYSAPVLAEIRLCLNKELQPINCAYRSSGCGRGSIFYLPQHTDLAGPQTLPTPLLLNFSWLLAIASIPFPLHRLL